MEQRPPLDSSPVAPSRALALIRRVARPLWLRVGIAAVLEVSDRRTGTPVRVTVIPWEVDGNSYLLSQYGVTDWVRSLRAAGRGELRRKGRSEAFKSIEVDGDERDLVIATLYARTPKPFRRDFEQQRSRPSDLQGGADQIALGSTDSWPAPADPGSIRARAAGSATRSREGIGWRAPGDGRVAPAASAVRQIGWRGRSCGVHSRQMPA
jgi:hypothetical protein